MHDSSIRPVRTAPRILALLIAAFVHCAVLSVLSARRSNADVQNEDPIQKPFSAMVYLQPILTRPSHIPDGRILSPEKPSVVSSLSSKRVQKIDDTNQDAKPQDTLPEMLAVVEPAMTDVPSADTAGKTSSPLNIDELKAFARRDTTEQGKARSGKNVQIAQFKTLSSAAEKEAIERAQRPKCDNDYKPKVGSVEFSGLMKLPFLLKGAISDQGCKW